MDLNLRSFFPGVQKRFYRNIAEFRQPFRSHSHLLSGFYLNRVPLSEDFPVSRHLHRVSSRLYKSEYDRRIPQEIFLSGHLAISCYNFCQAPHISSRFHSIRNNKAHAARRLGSGIWIHTLICVHTYEYRVPVVLSIAELPSVHVFQSGHTAL